MNRLKNKVCLVTGAAKGIGAAIARAFSSEGADVVVTDLDDEMGQALAREIGARYVHLDVADEKDWGNLEAAYPAIDVLVNNAGITGHEGGNARHDPETARLDDWRNVHSVNLDGTFLGCRYAIRAMRTNGGRGSIINMSSRSGIVGVPKAAAYASSKAAIRNHTKTVALYCAEQGLEIRCNSIHPAAVWTEMWNVGASGSGESERRKRMLASSAPLNRVGRPEEVAAVCVFLASDEATFMTGTELTIDGGILAGSTTSHG